MISLTETGAPVARISERTKLHKQIQFMICESCFWCASRIEVILVW